MSRPTMLCLLPILGSLALLALAPSSSGQGLPGGPPLLLPGDTASGPSGGIQHFPDVAVGPNSYLTAWPDYRSAFTTLTTSVGTHDLFAMRTAADGSPLDAVPFRIAGDAGEKSRVQVAWNGAHWLVTWLQKTDNGFSNSIELRGARVAPNGTVVDAPALSIRKYQWSSAARYALASDGVGFAIVIQGSQGGESNVEGRLIAADGTVSAAGPSTLLSSTSLWAGFALGHVAGTYLLAAGDGSGTGVQGRLLSGVLAPVGGTFSLGSGSVPAIATDSADFMVAYTVGSSGPQVAYRKVTPLGQVGAQVIVTPSGALDYAYDPDIAWNGNGFTIVYTYGLFPPATLRFANIAANGTLLDFGGVPLNHGVEPHNPRIASMGAGRSQVAWYDWSTTPPHFGDVAGASVGPGSAVGPLMPLGVGTPRQGSPDLAAGGMGYLAVFTSERGGSVSILAQRLDAAGDALDAEPIEVAVGDAYGHPRVAWNGTHFLVVFEDLIELGISTFETNDVTLARRIAPDGSSPDATPFVVLDGRSPDVAAAGGVFLVVASRAVTTEIRRIFGARVDAQGVVLDVVAQQVGGNHAVAPSAAAFGDRWLVAWDRKPTHDSTLHSARANVVLADLSPLGEIDLGGGSRPCAAAAPDTGLVAWFSGGEVTAQRIGKAGQLLGAPFVLTAAPGNQLHPSADWSGNEFVVAWEDERAFAIYFDHRRDIYAARVQEDGAVLDFDGYAVGTSVEHEQMPAVAASAGNVLIAYALFLPGAPHANVRIALDDSGVRGAFVAYGLGCAGALGVAPALAGSGVPAPGAPIGIAVTGGPAAGAGFLYAGTAKGALPLLGCTFLVGGTLLPPIALPLDAAGSIAFTATLPAPLPPGLIVDLQFLGLDAGAPNGVFSASNGLEMQVP